MARRRVTDPRSLQYWTDKFQPIGDPGTTIKGRAVRQIAVQRRRRSWLRWRRSEIQNYVYAIDATREIVYAPRPTYPVVMKMGPSISDFRRTGTPPMSTYWRNFTKPDYAWLRRNDYELT